MKKNSIFNLGIAIILGFGSLTASSSKSYALPESSQLIDLSSCTDLNSQAQQDELGGLKIPISGKGQYSTPINLIAVNNEELLTNCSDLSRASDREFYVEKVGFYKRNPVRTLPHIPRLEPSILGKANKDRHLAIVREFYEHSKTPDFLNGYSKPNENIRSTISGSDGYSKTHALSNPEIASFNATKRIDQ